MSLAPRELVLTVLAVFALLLVVSALVRRFAADSVVHLRKPNGLFVTFTTSTGLLLAARCRLRGRRRRRARRAWPQPDPRDRGHHGGGGGLDRLASEHARQRGWRRRAAARRLDRSGRLDPARERSRGARRGDSMAAHRARHARWRRGRVAPQVSSRRARARRSTSTSDSPAFTARFGDQPARTRPPPSPFIGSSSVSDTAPWRSPI